MHLYNRHDCAVDNLCFSLWDQERERIYLLFFEVLNRASRYDEPTRALFDFHLTWLPVQANCWQKSSKVVDIFTKLSSDFHVNSDDNKFATNRV